MTYAMRREEALALLKQYATSGGFVRLTQVAQALLEPMPSDPLVAETYRRAMRVGLLPRVLAVDPRMAQLLAMDT